jgi:hypothetical protein
MKELGGKEAKKVSSLRNVEKKKEGFCVPCVALLN